MRLSRIKINWQFLKIATSSDVLWSADFRDIDRAIKNFQIVGLTFTEPQGKQ
jgi:hypothetical protein